MTSNLYQEQSSQFDYKQLKGMKQKFEGKPSNDQGSFLAASQSLFTKLEWSKWNIAQEVTSISCDAGSSIHFLFDLRIVQISIKSMIRARLRVFT